MKMHPCTKADKHTEFVRSLFSATCSELGPDKLVSLSETLGNYIAGQCTIAYCDGKTAGVEQTALHCARAR